jgi:outer membrane protein assembly factor BamA
MAIWTVVLCLAAGVHAQAPAPALRPPQTTAQAPAQSETERVVAIRIVDEKGQVLEENPDPLPQQRNQPLDSDAVRESLRQLYRTGRYADLRAEITPVAGGVRLDFVVRRNFFMNLVRVTGLTAHPGELAALASLNLSLGEPFRESGLKEALGRLTQTLHDEGLYQARLAYDLTPHEDTRQMDITVRVTPGPRARVGGIALRNHTELPDAELLGRSKLRPGKEVSSTRLNRASERMRQLLVRRDYLGARVNLHRGEYDGRSNTLPLEIEVIAGLKVRVEVAGAKIPAKELRKRLPIYQEGAVDEDLLQEGRRAIRDYLEREGYADVQVQYTTSEVPAKGEGRGTTPSEHVITYHIERGPRYRLMGIAFDGNKYFSDDLLLSRLRLQPAAFASRGRFSAPMMQDDAASIRDLYAANGFREATVRPEVDNNYKGKKSDFFVRFHIVEGLQTRVAELKLEGNRALGGDELLAAIGSTTGEPYSDFNVSSDRDNILALYYNDGFPEARFSAEVEEIPGVAAAPAVRRAPSSRAEEPAQALAEYKRVRLIYHIVEGPQISVARVLIGGYEHTLPRVVEREVEIKPEGPLREGDVVETQRRLYNLGIFSRVSIAPQNPNGTDTDKAVVVLVEEANRYTIAYGGGFEVQRMGSTSDPTGGGLSASPRGILEVSKANLTGRADTLSFKARASTLQWRGLMSYTAPNAFGRPELSLQLTALADRSRDILTFVSTRYEGSFQIAQRVSLVTSLLYRYSFRHVLASSLQSTLSLDQIPLFNQPTRVSLFGGTWVRERRDNPADATHGDFNTVDVSVAGRPIGSSATFSRFLFQDSSYHPLRRRFTFARSTRFGFEQPFGASTATSIPLPERFFAGGGLSLRGFGLNQAGPRDPGTGFPVGGLAMLIFNQELRFPMRLPFVGNRVGGAIFYDAGNVFQNVRRITFRTSPPSAGDLNYFSHTVGFSFRYATPIGPVLVDLAYQLNAPLFLVPGGGASCPTGNPATPTAPCQRLPRFQFFFNLGQIF